MIIEIYDDLCNICLVPKTPVFSKERLQWIPEGLLICKDTLRLIN